MVAKQGILKFEKRRCVIGIVILPIAYFLFSCLVGFHRGTWQDFFETLFAFFLLFFPFALIVMLGALTQLEWFHIYEDRIEAQGILGQKNIVYYKDVAFVEELEISLTAKGYFTPFFIFHDGRKNNGNILNSNSCHNKKRYNLRIYKTPELEDYILNTLHLEIKKTERS